MAKEIILSNMALAIKIYSELIEVKRDKIYI